MAFQPKWFEILRPHGEASLKLFCFPYAGGSANIYRSWQQHMPLGVSLCLVHLPGRARRFSELPFTRLDSLLAALTETIVPEIKGEFAFLGHSMGALISFELARRLRDSSYLPRAIFLSGYPAPQACPKEPTRFDLPEEEFIVQLNSLNGTPKDLLENLETRHLFLPTIRADFEIVEMYQYVHQAPLACPIYVYGGLEDLEVPVERLPAWKEQTSGQFKMTIFPGGHFFIHTCEEFFRVVRADLQDSALKKAANP